MWLHMKTLPDDKKGGVMRLALSGVAKEAARNVGIDHLVLPTGYQTLLECLRLIFGGSESQRGHDAHRTLKALYRGSRQMEEYFATIGQALVQCRINGYSMSCKTAAAIVLDQVGLDANQQASTKAAAAVLTLKGSDTLNDVLLCPDVGCRRPSSPAARSCDNGVLGGGARRCRLPNGGEGAWGGGPLVHVRRRPPDDQCARQPRRGGRAVGRQGGGGHGDARSGRIRDAIGRRGRGGPSDAQLQRGAARAPAASLAAASRPGHAAPVPASTRQGTEPASPHTPSRSTAVADVGGPGPRAPVPATVASCSGADERAACVLGAGSTHDPRVPALRAFVLAAVVTSDTPDLHRKAFKLHTQYVHCSAARLNELLRTAGAQDAKVFEAVTAAVDGCDACKLTASRPPRPPVAVPRALQFNDTVAVDLAQVAPIGAFLHMVDLGTRFSKAVAIANNAQSTRRAT